MLRDQKIYTILCTLFSILIVIGNLTYQKFVTIDLFHIHAFNLSVGAILYPLTFLITDLIAEFYGKIEANFCVKLAMLINIIVALLIAFMDFMPAISWSKIDDEVFHRVFGFYSVAFIGSILACYISQSVDIMIYLNLRKITGPKYLWLRNNLSTLISLLIDTVIVVSFLSFFGVLDKNHMVHIIIDSYSWKMFFTICSTPLFYLCVAAIKFACK